MYTIGQIAEMFQIPVSTLRYYDKDEPSKKRMISSLENGHAASSPKPSAKLPINSRQVMGFMLAM